MRLYLLNLGRIRKIDSPIEGYLIRLDDSDLDQVVCTHLDPDHCGGHEECTATIESNGRSCSTPPLLQPRLLRPNAGTTSSRGQALYKSRAARRAPSRRVIVVASNSPN